MLCFVSAERSPFVYHLHAPTSPSCGPSLLPLTTLIPTIHQHFEFYWLFFSPAESKSESHSQSQTLWSLAFRKTYTILDSQTCIRGSTPIYFTATHLLKQSEANPLKLELYVQRAASEERKRKNCVFPNSDYCLFLQCFFSSSSCLHAPLHAFPSWRFFLHTCPSLLSSLQIGSVLRNSLESLRWKKAWRETLQFSNHPHKATIVHLPLM